MSKITINSANLAAPDLSAYRQLLKRFRCLPDRLIHIDPRLQRLTLFLRRKPVFTCPVSTSRLGLGEREGSNMTPRGLHRVCTVMGRGHPPGRVFRSRRARTDIWTPEAPPTDEDLILSRILWLDGLEAGLNRGGIVDTRRRYIYLHGTNHEDQIGRPASAGCIRLRNQDIIQLADQWMAVGALCLIQNSSN